MARFASGSGPDGNCDCLPVSRRPKHASRPAKFDGNLLQSVALLDILRFTFDKELAIGTPARELTIKLRY